MFVKIHFPTVIDGLGRVVPEQIVALSGREALPLIKSGAATPDPELDELKRRAREKGQAVDWADQPQFQSLRVRGGIVATTDQESFGKRVKKAAQRSPHSPKSHQERAEKERNRYRKLTRRPRTKGE
jgi:hypothetical protein